MTDTISQPNTASQPPVMIPTMTIASTAQSEQPLLSEQSLVDTQTNARFGGVVVSGVLVNDSKNIFERSRRVSQYSERTLMSIARFPTLKELKLLDMFIHDSLQQEERSTLNLSKLEQRMRAETIKRLVSHTKEIVAPILLEQDRLRMLQLTKSPAAARLPRRHALRFLTELKDDYLDRYVETPEFDQACCDMARAILSLQLTYLPRRGDLTLFSFSNESESSATTIGAAPHEPSSIESHFYYHGIRENGRGPKLIYRSSSDVYEEPTGPEEYKRLMRLVAVPDNHVFGQNCLWQRVQAKVVELLDAKAVRLTCVDFVRFTWLNKKDRMIDIREGGGDNAYDKVFSYNDIPLIIPTEDGKRHYSNPTIWVGVVPNTLTAAIAFDVTKSIRAFLEELNVTDVDIAYRETVPNFSAGPALFPPVGILSNCKGFIDPLSVALSLPIAGLKTTMQGTMGPYFHVGNTLYAITARHNLFLANEGNEEFTFNPSAPKMNVVLMSNAAFTGYLTLIQAHIGTLIETINTMQTKIEAFRANVQNKIDLPQSQLDLDNYVAERDRLQNIIAELKAFFVDIKKHWRKPIQRVIGHVVWAPPIGVGIPPHQYTRDFCVVQLHKEKFTHLLGNVLSLGPEYSSTKLKTLLNARTDVPSTFQYPTDGLLTLRGVLKAQQIINPDNMTLKGNPVRRVIKHGFTTNTTVGTVTRFTSFVRKYFPTGNLDSIELPIIPHEDDTGTFSKGGDSGSIIVSVKGEFISLLTSGTNIGTDGSDITYSTPFEWIWELVCQKFPGANLYWDDMSAFLAA